MIAKIIVGFCAVVCVSGYWELKEATKLCKSQSECKNHECCSKRFSKDEAYCVQRRQEGEMCLADEVGDTMVDGLYDITCPCAGNLKCIREEYTTKNGMVMSLGNPRCRQPNFSGSYSKSRAKSSASAKSRPRSSASAKSRARSSASAKSRARNSASAKSDANSYARAGSDASNSVSSGSDARSSSSSAGSDASSSASSGSDASSSAYAGSDASNSASAEA